MQLTYIPAPSLWTPQTVQSGPSVQILDALYRPEQTKRTPLPQNAGHKLSEISAILLGLAGLKTLYSSIAQSVERRTVNP